jgi:hypothetical protein
MDLAVDEVALERLREAEEEAGSARFRAASEPDQERVPIEAPRAPRTGSNLSTSALTLCFRGFSLWCLPCIAELPAAGL